MAGARCRKTSHSPEGQNPSGCRYRGFEAVRRHRIPPGRQLFWTIFRQLRLGTTAGFQVPSTSALSPRCAMAPRFERASRCHESGRLVINGGSFRLIQYKMSSGGVFAPVTTHEPSPRLPGWITQDQVSTRRPANFCCFSVIRAGGRNRPHQLAIHRHTRLSDLRSLLQPPPAKTLIPKISRDAFFPL